MLKSLVLRRYVKSLSFRFNHLVFILLSLTSMLLLSVQNASTAQVILTWDAPTTNADGTPLTDLSGYKVYYGTASGNYTQNIDIGNVTTYTVANLTDGLTYYFAVTAYNTSGNESGYSNEVNKTIPSTQQYTLTVSKGGTGTGMVTSSPSGINCGSDCSEAYNPGTVVTLTALPDASSTFAGWSGGCTGTGTCNLRMDAVKTVTATFTIKIYTITATAGTGGTITPSVTVNHGANQTFAITPNTNYAIADVLVDGNSVGAVTTYTLTNVTANHSISASFTMNTYDLTVNKGGTGTGMVTSSPAGINCGSDCSGVYDAGTVVTLTASPDTSSTFAGWSGGCTGTCNLRMDAVKTVTATFTIKIYTITATAGTGGTIAPLGTVTVNHGASQTFIITPDLNYSVYDVLIDGSSIGPVLTYTFTNVTSSHAISVSFTLLDYDSDGIPDIEEQGPQLNNANYDGNNDGIPDYLQSNAASFYTFDRTNYITLFSPDGYTLSNVTVAQLPEGAPLEASFPYGFVEFRIENLPQEAATNIIIKLPEETPVNSYYKYGPTPEDPTPHWYDFLFDGQTGAEISGSLITLHFIDGLRGDDDLTVNGQILNRGGPARTPDITVTPPSYNFGTVSIYTISPAQLFTVSNDGAANLSISTVTIEGTDAGNFIIQNDTCSSQSLTPSSTCTISVVFSPLSADNKNAILKISSNDLSTPILNIPLSGTGKIQQYTLTINKTGNGTVISSPSGISCGGTCSNTFNKGTTITLTSNSDNDSIFNGWSGSGCTGTGTCTLTMDAANAVTATFTLKTYTITATAGTGGTISPSGTVTVSHGANQTFTITPDTTCRLADVKVDGTSMGSLSAYSFSNITANHAIEAIFAIDSQSPTVPTNLQAAAISLSQINLSWTASTDNVGVAGYKVYRNGTQIATTSNTNYSDTGLSLATTYIYTVAAYDSAGNVSGQSNSASATTFSIIPKTNWSLKYADSQELVGENGAAVNGFDNNGGTIWHTKYIGGSPYTPHEIQIDMGGVNSINGFRYLPRQDGGVNGRIGQYEFYVSIDGSNWGNPVTTGTFANSAIEKEVLFTSKTGQFIRLRALTEVNGNPWTSIAEINVLGGPSSGNYPPNGVIDSPAANMTINVGDRVNFAGTGGDPDGNLPLSFLWRFGTGSGIPDSTLESPGLVQFNTPGTYTITFTVTDALGLSDPTPESREITVVALGGGVIPKSNWSLKYVDSQELVGENGAAVNGFDNKSGTIWHTKYIGGSPYPPHEIQIDMGGVYSINGFRYLPRQDGGVNGRIGQYEFYVSIDGSNWGNPVTTGTFANSAIEKEVLFTSKTGQFIRLRALTEVNGEPWTSMAEINVLEM